MSDLLVIEFSSEEKAEGVREILLAMHSEYLIELSDAVIAMKETNERSSSISFSSLPPRTSQPGNSGAR